MIISLQAVRSCSALHFAWPGAKRKEALGESWIQNCWWLWLWIALASTGWVSCCDFLFIASSKRWFCWRFSLLPLSSRSPSASSPSPRPSFAWTPRSATFSASAIPPSTVFSPSLCAISRADGWCPLHSWFPARTFWWSWTPHSLVSFPSQAAGSSHKLPNDPRFRCSSSPAILFLLRWSFLPLQGIYCRAWRSPGDRHRTICLSLGSACLFSCLVPLSKAWGLRLYWLNFPWPFQSPAFRSRPIRLLWSHCSGCWASWKVASRPVSQYPTEVFLRVCPAGQRLTF